MRAEGSKPRIALKYKCLQGLWHKQGITLGLNTPPSTNLPQTQSLRVKKFVFWNFSEKFSKRKQKVYVQGENGIGIKSRNKGKQKR